MENIRKKQIKNLFNDFINTLFNGIWFFRVEGCGKYKEWYSNGQIYIDANYNENGKKIGKYKEWYENGQIYIDANYNEKGKLNGEYKRWNENGDLIFEIEFKDNKLISINYINFNYNKSWFSYYDQMQRKHVYFYDKIKDLYNNEKYKKTTII